MLHAVPLTGIQRRKTAASSTATGIRTPASGLRARCLDLSTIAACGGSGATRTPKGLATPTCFRDRLLIQPDRFRGALGGIRTHDLVRTRDVLFFLSYKGMASPPPLVDAASGVSSGVPGKAGLAGTIRTCDPRLRRAVLCSTELRRDERRRQESNLQLPDS
jgi:hypothetical protein